MSCWYMFEDTAVRCTTTMYTGLTNIGSFWIISMYIGHSAGIAGIIEDFWNLKGILVTNLFWVTWSPSVSRWRAPFCSTIKGYTLLYTNNILRLQSTNPGWSCKSSWKWKIILKNSIYPNIYLSELSSIATVRGPTLPVHLYTRGYSLTSLMFLLVQFNYVGLQNVLLICLLWF